MLPILKRIGVGILKGFPLVNSIKEIIKPSIKEGSIIKADYIQLVTEIVTVALIYAFVMGKINMDELMKLIGLL